MEHILFVFNKSTKQCPGEKGRSCSLDMAQNYRISARCQRTGLSLVEEISYLDEKEFLIRMLVDSIQYKNVGSGDRWDVCGLFLIFD